MIFENKKKILYRAFNVVRRLCSFDNKVMFNVLIICIYLVSLITQNKHILMKNINWQVFKMCYINGLRKTKSKKNIDMFLFLIFNKF